MHIPWYIYILVLIVGVVAGATSSIAALDPEGRGERVSTAGFLIACIAVVLLVVLLALDLWRWFSGS